MVNDLNAISAKFSSIHYVTIVQCFHNLSIRISSVLIANVYCDILTHSFETYNI